MSDILAGLVLVAGMCQGAWVTLNPCCRCEVGR